MNISLGGFHSIIAEHPQLKRICKWILKLLTPKQMQHRKDVCTECKERLEQESENLLKRIIIADKALLYHDDPTMKQQNNEWKHPFSSTPKKAKFVKSAGYDHGFFYCEGIV